MTTLFLIFEEVYCSPIFGTCSSKLLEILCEIMLPTHLVERKVYVYTCSGMKVTCNEMKGVYLEDYLYEIIELKCIIQIKYLF